MLLTCSFRNNARYYGGYENIEGGHGGAADPKQQAFMLCLFYEFVKRTVGTSLSPPLADPHK